VAGHYHLTWADAGIVAVMGLVYTALCFSLFTDGLRFVAVEHAGILGYLEPVTAPLWASCWSASGRRRRPGWVEH